MVKPFCFTLNESGGNSSVRQIPNDTAAKSSAGHPEALPSFESAWTCLVAFSNGGLGPSWGLVEMD